MKKIKRFFESEIVYLRGNALIPSKSISYKVDKLTGEKILIEKANTHKFENELKDDFRKDLKNINIFPTNKDVLISIVHGIHSSKEYKKCDLDNRAKCILDALKEVVYVDDSQVRMLFSYIY